MKSADSAMMYNIPVVSELNRVPNFDPLKFLRKTENGPQLDLKYKKLWFRLKYPQGRIRVSNLRITDQLAMIEARVFFDRKDTEAVASYTVTCEAKSAPDGQYVKLAQDLATDQVLSDAGFGIQFISANGTEMPAVAVKPKLNQETKVERREPVAPIVQPTVAEQRVVVEKPQTVSEAVSVTETITEKAPPIVETRTVTETRSEEHIAHIPETSENVATKPVSVATEERVERIIPIATDVNGMKTTPFTTVAETAEETIAKAEENTATSIRPAYSKEMSVEDICALMSLEEAENYVVTSGACAGQKLSLVAERRAASLRFYINGYKGDDNILRAAATLILAARPELQAS